MDLKSLILKSASQPDVQQFRRLEASEAARLRTIDPSNNARARILNAKEDAHRKIIKAEEDSRPQESVEEADKKLIVVLQDIKDRPHTKVCCDTMCFSLFSSCTHVVCHV